MREAWARPCPCIMSVRRRARHTGRATFLPISTSTKAQRSDLRYSPVSDLDYGTLLCWATNAVGTQRTPCTFTVFPAGKPDVPSSCLAFNETEESMCVSCEPGYSGGVEQSFLLEAWDDGVVRATDTGDAPLLQGGQGRGSGKERTNSRNSKDHPVKWVTQPYNLPFKPSEITDLPRNANFSQQHKSLHLSMQTGGTPTLSPHSKTCEFFIGDEKVLSRNSTSPSSPLYFTSAVHVKSLVKEEVENVETGGNRWRNGGETVENVGETGGETVEKQMSGHQPAAGVTSDFL
ncbi:hypothetical protein GWK47_024836 [Chionoecetes opilio]|uniref:Uncharacterized protein n=1 Tax=Chionoecetes opilio TaxID=41210 RepID=A0A8J4XV35_CHIOP|nr:hypothetical protein GWK47_024836 [Chionoecetes opilio]